MQVISTSWRTGGSTTQVCNTEIERVVRQREGKPAPSYGKDRRRPKPKHVILISICLCFLSNNTAIDACNSVCNIKCTKKHQ